MISNQKHNRDTVGKEKLQAFETVSDESKRAFARKSLTKRVCFNQITLINLGKSNESTDKLTEKRVVQNDSLTLETFSQYCEIGSSQYPGEKENRTLNKPFSTNSLHS